MTRMTARHPAGRHRTADGRQENVAKLSRVRSCPHASQAGPQARFLACEDLVLSEAVTR